MRIAASLCPERWRHLVAFRKGDVQKQVGRRHSARRWYRMAIQLQPNESGYWVFLGGMLLSEGRLDEAVTEFENGLREATLGPIEELRLNYGIALRGLGRTEEAEAQFLRALAICPDYEEARVALQDVSGREPS